MHSITTNSLASHNSPFLSHSFRWHSSARFSAVLQSGVGQDWLPSGSLTGEGSTFDLTCCQWYSRPCDWKVEAGCWPEAALSSPSHGHNRATFFFKANKRQSPLSWADVTRWTYWIHMRVIHGSRHLDCIHLGRSICRSHPCSRESTPQGADTKRRGLPLSVPPQFPGIHPCSVEHLEHMGLILSTISYDGIEPLPNLQITKGREKIHIVL